MRKSLLSIVLSLAAATPAWAGYIAQSGTVTPGHAIEWASDGVGIDAGPATAGNLTELGVTKAGGNAICVNSGPITSSYQELCLGATTNSGATITLQNLAGAPQEPLKFIVDGVTVLSLSSSTTGLVTVTGTPTTGDCASWTGPSSIGDSGGACGGSSSSIPTNRILGNNSGTTQPAFALTPEQVNTMMFLLDNAVSEGADPTGTADSTTALNTAFATCAAYIPPGTYKVSGNLTTGSCTNITIVGAGSAVTTLTATGTNNTLLNNGATNGIIQGIHFDRSGTPAVSGAVGLSMAGVTDQFKLYDLKSSNQYTGFILGPAAWGFADRLEADNGYGPGFLMTNLFFSGSMQWNFSNSLAQENNGWGVQVTSNFAGVSYMLPWYNISTFANTAGGIQVSGSSSNSIENFQLVNGILNGDGGDELQIGSYGVLPILVSNTQGGSSGLIATGRGQGTAASHVGNGINVVGAENILDLVQDNIQGSSRDGVVIQSGALNYLYATDVISQLNGQSSPGSTYHGLSIGTPLTGIITGGNYGNRNGSTAQAYGIGAANGNGLTFQGVSVPGNNVNGIVLNSNASLAFCSGIQGESMTLIGCNQGGGGGGGGVTSITAGTNVALSPSPIVSTGSVSVVNNPTFSGNVTANGGVSFGSGQQACWSTICDGAALGARQLGIASTQILAESPLNPVNDNTIALGTSALRWSDLRSNTATFSSTVTFNGNANFGTGDQICWSTICDGAALGARQVGIGSTQILAEAALNPVNDNTIALGTPSLRWSDLQTNTATFSGTITTGITGSAQCLQVNTSGVISGTGAVCGGSGSTPGGTSGQIQWNNGGVFAGLTMSGDCTIVASTGVITCLKTNGVNFGTAATVNTGTSGATIPLLNGNNTYSGTSTFSAAITANANIGFGTGDQICWSTICDGAALGARQVGIGATSILAEANLTPVNDNTIALGTSALRWSDVRTNTETLTGNLTTNITGSTQCVQANSSGVLSGTGSACGSGGGGVSSVTGSGAVTASPTTGAVVVSLTSASDSTVVSNISGSSAAPTSNTVTSVLDHVIGSAAGDLAVRGLSSWVALAPGSQGSVMYGASGGAPAWLGPGSSGQVLTSQGASANPTWTSVTASAGGSNGQIQVNSSGSLAGFTLAGDCTFSNPNITCTKSSGSAFGTAAFDNTGTSGATIPLLNGTNTWASTQTFSSAPTLSAGATAANNQTISWGSGNSTIAGNGSGVLTLHSSFTIAADTGTFGPLTDNATHNGNSGDRWIDVWAVNGTIQTSDARFKHDIQDSDLGLDFINRIRPVSFLMNDGDGHRHYGVTVQQLETALKGEDFGGIHKGANDNDAMGLNYDELIGPLIKSVQQLSAENVELKRRLDVLEHKQSKARAVGRHS